MILVIDNYDSFVHNLARYVRQCGGETKVVRNDQIDVQTIRRMSPSAIIISPGPCTPNESGCSLKVVEELGSELPILGVCLGHQAIVQSYGGRIITTQPVHGESSIIHHDGTQIFQNLPSPLTVGRYHSLVAAKDSLPDCLDVLAETDDKVVMAVAHSEHPVVGVQFHPESILTEKGYLMIENFLEMLDPRVKQTPRKANAS